MRRVAGFAATAERRDKLDGDIGHSRSVLRRLFYAGKMIQQHGYGRMYLNQLLNNE